MWYNYVSTGQLIIWHVVALVDARAIIELFIMSNSDYNSCNGYIFWSSKLLRTKICYSQISMLLLWLSWMFMDDIFNLCASNPLSTSSITVILNGISMNSQLWIKSFAASTLRRVSRGWWFICITTQWIPWPCGSLAVDLCFLHTKWLRWHHSVIWGCMYYQPSDTWDALGGAVSPRLFIHSYTFMILDNSMFYGQ